MNKNSKIYIAGHKGLVGSAIVRKLEKEGFTNLILKSSKELDLRNQAAVKLFIEISRPDYVFLAAAKVGGIQSNNTYRADFLYDNLMIQNNVIHYSYLNNVKKLLFFRLLLHLSKASSSTPKRRIFTYGNIRIHQ